MQPHAVPTKQRRKYAPRGMDSKMIGVRLMPDEKQAVDSLANTEFRTASSMARILIRIGLEQYQRESNHVSR